MRRFALALLLLLVVLLWDSDAAAIADAEDLAISGRVWDDRNANGIQDEGEPGMQTVPLTLRGPGIGQFGRFARTNASGDYVFSGLVRGSYSVEIAGRANPYYQTYPRRTGKGDISAAVTLTNVSVGGMDFGLHLPLDAPVFYGLAAIDGRLIAEADVRAYIDGIDCSSGYLAPADDPRFYVRVVSETLIHGCGAPGKVVRFTVEGNQANETAVWSPAMRPDSSPLLLTVGPPFAYFFPTFETADGGFAGYPWQHQVEAVVNGRVCGVSEPYAQGTQVAVASHEAVPDCGREGDLVRFLVDGTRSDTTAVWRAGVQEAEIIFLVPSRPEAGATSGEKPSESVIRPPSAGAAGLKGR
jgi:hypothetical protein